MLVMRDGPSRRVGASGVVIGRSRDCDLVSADPRASRRHALVRLTMEGAEVVVLGGEPVSLNGKAVARAAALGHGDELAIPGLVLAVAIEAPPPRSDAATGFALERARGGQFGVAHTPFSIGGGAADDLNIKGWPAGVLRLLVAQGDLFVELCAGKATRNDAALAVGALEPLAAGDRLACRSETFTIRAATGAAATTAVVAREELPIKVAIELLPRGGRIVFQLPTGERAVYLADRRFDLLMALLRPPAPLRAGELVPDEVVRSVVWPRRVAAGRSELNMLISRCRRDLVEAGVAGPRLIERAPGGGATRIRLAAGAEIVVAT